MITTLLFFRSASTAYAIFPHLGATDVPLDVIPYIQQDVASPNCRITVQLNRSKDLQWHPLIDLVQQQDGFLFLHLHRKWQLRPGTLVSIQHTPDCAMDFGEWNFTTAEQSNLTPKNRLRGRRLAATKNYVHPSTIPYFLAFFLALLYLHAIQPDETEAIRAPRSLFAPSESDRLRAKEIMRLRKNAFETMQVIRNERKLHTEFNNAKFETIVDTIPEDGTYELSSQKNEYDRTYEIWISQVESHKEALDAKNLLDEKFVASHKFPPRFRITLDDMQALNISHYLVYQKMNTLRKLRKAMHPVCPDSVGLHRVSAEGTGEENGETDTGEVENGETGTDDTPSQRLVRVGKGNNGKGSRVAEDAWVGSGRKKGNSARVAEDAWVGKGKKGARVAGDAPDEASDASKPNPQACKRVPPPLSEFGGLMWQQGTVTRPSHDAAGVEHVVPASEFDAYLNPVTHPLLFGVRVVTSSVVGDFPAARPSEESLAQQFGAEVSALVLDTSHKDILDGSLSNLASQKASDSIAHSLRLYQWLGCDPATEVVSYFKQFNSANAVGKVKYHRYAQGKCVVHALPVTMHEMGQALVDMAKTYKSVITEYLKLAAAGFLPNGFNLRLQPLIYPASVVNKSMAFHLPQMTLSALAMALTGIAPTHLKLLQKLHIDFCVRDAHSGIVYESILTRKKLVFQFPSVCSTTLRALPMKNGSYNWIKSSNSSTDSLQRLKSAFETLVASWCGGYTVNDKRGQLSADAMVEGTELFTEDQAIEFLKIVPENPHNNTEYVSMSNEEYHDLSMMMVVLSHATNGTRVVGVNAASAYFPGGKMIHGACHSLEEAWCTTTSLFRSLMQAASLPSVNLVHATLQSQERISFGSRMSRKLLKPQPQLDPGELIQTYIPENGCILSPSADIFRRGRNEGYAFLPEPVALAGVVSVAAFNKNPDTDSPLDAPPSMEEYLQKVEAKWRAAVVGAIKLGAEVLVLPDLGCGAFQNDPVDVGKCLNFVLHETHGYFHRVILLGQASFIDAALLRFDHLTPCGVIQPTGTAEKGASDDFNPITHPCLKAMRVLPSTVYCVDGNTPTKCGFLPLAAAGQPIPVVLSDCYIDGESSDMSPRGRALLTWTQRPTVPSDVVNHFAREVSRAIFYSYGVQQWVIHCLPAPTTGSALYILCEMADIYAAIFRAYLGAVRAGAIPPHTRLRLKSLARLSRDDTLLPRISMTAIAMALTRFPFSDHAAFKAAGIDFCVGRMRDALKFQRALIQKIDQLQPLVVGERGGSIATHQGSFAWMLQHKDNSSRLARLKIFYASQQCIWNGVFFNSGAPITLRSVTKMLRETRVVSDEQAQTILETSYPRYRTKYIPIYSQRAIAMDVAARRADQGARVATIRATANDGAILTGMPTRDSWCVASTLLPSLLRAAKEADVPRDGCVLSPDVEIFRAHANQGHKYRDKSAQVSVVSFAPEGDASSRVNWRAALVAAWLSGAEVVVIPDIDSAPKSGEDLHTILNAVDGYFREVIILGDATFVSNSIGNFAKFDYKLIDHVWSGTKARTLMDLTRRPHAMRASGSGLGAMAQITHPFLRRVHFSSPTAECTFDPTLSEALSPMTIVVKVVSRKEWTDETAGNAVPKEVKRAFETSRNHAKLVSCGESCVIYAVRPRLEDMGQGATAIATTYRCVLSEYIHALTVALIPLGTTLKLSPLLSERDVERDLVADLPVMMLSGLAIALAHLPREHIRWLEKGKVCISLETTRSMVQYDLVADRKVEYLTQPPISELDFGKLAAKNNTYAWIRQHNSNADRLNRQLAAFQTLSAIWYRGYRIGGSLIHLKSVDPMLKSTAVFTDEQARCYLTLHANPRRDTAYVAMGTDKFPKWTTMRVCALQASVRQVCGVSAASAYHVGGGVLPGGRHALEESWCMISTLLPSLLQAANPHPASSQEGPAHLPLLKTFQPKQGCLAKLLGRKPQNTKMLNTPEFGPYIPYNGCVVSPDVEIFRDGDEGYAFLRTPVTLKCVVSIAAYNKNPKIRDCPVDFPDESVYLEHVEQKWRAALVAAIKEGADSIVIPDVGCGVFQNDPATMGSMLNTVLRQLDGWFRDVFVLGKPEFVAAALANFPHDPFDRTIAPSIPAPRYSSRLARRDSVFSVGDTILSGVGDQSLMHALDTVRCPVAGQVGVGAEVGHDTPDDSISTPIRQQKSASIVIPDKEARASENCGEEHRIDPFGTSPTAGSSQGNEPANDDMPACESISPNLDMPTCESSYNQRKVISL